MWQKVGCVVWKGSLIHWYRDVIMSCQCLTLLPSFLNGSTKLKNSLRWNLQMGANSEIHLVPSSYNWCKDLQSRLPPFLHYRLIIQSLIIICHNAVRRINQGVPLYIYISIYLSTPQRSRPVLAPPTSVRQILSLVCTDRIFIHGVPGASLDLVGQNIWRSNWSNCDVVDSLMCRDFLFGYREAGRHGIGWEKTSRSHWHPLVCHIFVPFLHTIRWTIKTYQNMNQCKSLLAEDLIIGSYWNGLEIQGSFVHSLWPLHATSLMAPVGPWCIRPACRRASAQSKSKSSKATQATTSGWSSQRDLLVFRPNMSQFREPWWVSLQTGFERWRVDAVFSEWLLMHAGCSRARLGGAMDS